MVLHGSLQEIHAGKAACQLFRNQQHDHGSTAADYNGVNQNTKRLGQTGTDRIFALGSGSRAGSGAGTGFIGKQAALDPVHKNSSETAGYRLTHAEGLWKDTAEYGRKLWQINQDNEQCKQEKTNRHDGNHNIQNFYGCVFPKHNDCSQ